MSDSRAARFKRLEPLIDRALELEGEQRERFLALCAEIHGDLIADLRRALQPDALPDIGAVAASATAAPATDRRGLSVGNWKLIERLGRGGMSSVYRAERIVPAGLQAAVKLLRGGDAARRELFERERGLLARLVHPSIARLLDGGSHRDLRLCKSGRRRLSRLAPARRDGGRAHLGGLGGDFVRGGDGHARQTDARRVGPKAGSASTGE